MKDIEDGRDTPEDFPPPEFPVRKIRIVIAVCVAVVLVIVGIFIWMMIRDVTRKGSGGVKSTSAAGHEVARGMERRVVNCSNVRGLTPISRYRGRS